MKTYWVIGIMMAAGMNANGKSRDCDVTLRVVNNVGMSAGTLVNAAKLKASEMFREAGVKVRETGSSCGVQLLIEIENGNDYGGHQSALAYAMPYKTAGTNIHVFLDRVGQLGNRPSFVIGLLAHVMVHEITHVLQLIDRPSAGGVMKASWTREDYQRMDLDRIPFATEDVELIRKGLASRNTPTKAE